MPRIPLVSEASMTDAQRRVYDAMTSGPRRSPPVGPLAAAVHRPDLAEKWSDLGLILRVNSSFPPRLREFVICPLLPLPMNRQSRRTGWLRLS
jgi:4-carboxymuconolactone decarboxylase